jgi:hypothetical protein
MSRKQHKPYLWCLIACLVTLVSADAFSKEAIAYVPILELKLPAKPDAHAIDLYQANERLTRPSVLLGQLVVGSDGKQSVEQLVAAAREKAAELGADFVILVKESTRTKIHSDPTFASAIPFLGGAFSVAHAGNVEVQNIPTILVAIGAYNRSVIGVDWERDGLKQGRYVVSDFKSYSRAQESGLKLGDEVTEINEMNPADKRLKQIMFESPAGTIFKYHIKRGTDRLDVDLESVTPK